MNTVLPNPLINVTTNNTVKGALTFFSILISYTISFSQTSWIGGTSTAWSTASNWTAGVPTASSDAFIGDASFTGTNRPTISSIATCKNLIVGGVVTSSLTVNSSLTISGNLTINANGTFTHGNVNVTINGNWSNSGTYSPTSANSAVVFGGTTQSINASVTNTFRVLTINSNSTVILNTNIAVNEQFNVNGTINPNENPMFTVSGVGATVVGSTGVIKVTGSTTSANYTMSGAATLNTGCTFDYCATAIDQSINTGIVYSNLVVSGSTKTIAANLPALASNSASVGNIYINSGTLDLSNFTANRGTTRAGGTLSIAEGATLKIGGTNTIPANFATRTFASASTVQYSGSAQTVSSAPYGNLTLSNSGVKTMPISALSIAGNFTTSGTVSVTAGASMTIGGNVMLGSGSTFNQGTFTHNIAGDWFNDGATINPGSSTINLNGTTIQILDGSVAQLPINNLTISNTIAAVLVKIDVNITGTLNLNGVNTLLMPDDAAVFNSNGAAGTITGTGTVQVTRLTAPANYTNQYKFATNTLTNLTIEYAGAGDQLINGLTYSNLKISGTGTKTSAAAPVINNTLTIATGATFDLGTFALTGSLSSLSGSGSLKTQNTSATPVPTGKTWSFTVYYNSTSAQSIVVGNYSNLDGSGGNRTLPAATISISGTFTPGNGTYTSTGNTINYNSTSAQTIAGFVYNNLIASGASVKSVGSNLTVVNTLTLAASTTLSLGSNNITLRSDAANTARVAAIPITATITYGTGRFIAERYVGSGRKYRLITSPVTTGTGILSPGQENQSIWGNWQNQGSNIVNVGTLITGGANVDGFDPQSSAASLYTYDANNRKFVGFTSANGKKTKYTPLRAGEGYYMFVYGDRLNSVNASTPNNTVLKSTGTLTVGDQTYNTTSAIPLSNVAGVFTLLGNPFASAIDWNAVTKTNVSNVVYGWDRNLAGTGGYVTVSVSLLGGALISPISSVVGFNQYIQSGQAFFVKTTAAGPSITIKEIDKVANNNTNSFRTAGTNSIPLMAVNLLFNSAGTAMLADGVVAAYHASFSNQVTDDDATKMMSSTEGIAIVNEGTSLSIDTRQVPQNNDTMFLNVTRLTKAQYTLEIFSQQLQGMTAEPFLEDSYLQTSTPLSLTDTNRIVFNVSTSDPASFNTSRFRIVFKEANVLPVAFTDIKAAQKDKNIQIDWRVASQTGITGYEVEKSPDGINFIKTTSVAAKSNSSVASYTWPDVNPLQGNNYYRIKAIQTDGRIVISNVVVVKMNVTKPGVLVFPNPVKGQQINVQLNAMEKGKLTLLLLNTEGRTVLKKLISYHGGNESNMMQLTNSLKTGLYYLQVLDGKKAHNQPVMIE